LKKSNSDSKDNSFKKFQDFLKLHADISSIGTSQIIATLTSTVLWFYLAASLGTEEYGRISYLFAAATIAFSISHLGSKTTVTVFTAKEGKSQPTLYFISIISSIVASIVIFFIFEQIGLSLFVIGSAIFALATGDLLGRKLYKKFSKDLITQRFLLASLALVFYFLLGPDGVILGFALSFFPYIYRLFYGFKEERIEFSAIKKRLDFIIHSYADDLSSAFMYNIDKLIILPLFGFVLLGNYQLAFQFLLALSILPQTTYQYILPKDSTGGASPKLKMITVYASIGLAILSIVLAPIFVPILFPQFDESIQIIQIMSIAIVPITINFMYKSKFLGNEKSKTVFVAATIYVAVQVLGMIILGDLYGINGTAAALVLGAFAQTLFYLGADINFKKIPHK